MFELIYLLFASHVELPIGWDQDHLFLEISLCQLPTFFYYFLISYLILPVNGLNIIDPFPLLLATHQFLF